jgi:hypothetical protein
MRTEPLCSQQSSDSELRFYECYVYEPANKRIYFSLAFDAPSGYVLTRPVQKGQCFTPVANQLLPLSTTILLGNGSTTGRASSTWNACRISIDYPCMLRMLPGGESLLTLAQHIPVQLGMFPSTTAEGAHLVADRSAMILFREVMSTVGTYLFQHLPILIAFIALVRLGLPRSRPMYALSSSQLALGIPYLPISRLTEVPRWRTYQ